MFKRYFIAGLIVLVPVWVTLLLLRFFVNFFDQILMLIPQAYRPDALLGFHVPGLGLLLTVILVFFVGLLVTNFFGKKLLHFWESILKRIPLVRSIYMGIKKVLITVFNSGDMSFRKVLLIEYPRKGLWSIAFQTSVGFERVQQHTQEEMLTIFVPTTPNPTSGFLMMISKKDAVELDISVDEALKMVISLGVILPEGRKLPL
ncbi:MAG: DUF502 domain-containing protein [Gammaproteobacteria bacterium]|nr:DUF502 domain-containing protein [Gammaproteobacteria bacterium]